MTLMTMKYRANFYANNRTSLIIGIEGTNKWKLLKEIREIALGERFIGSEAYLYVEDENGTTVFHGGYFPKVGIRYSTFNRKELW